MRNCRVALSWWIIWQQTNTYLLSFQSKLCDCSLLSCMQRKDFISKFNKSTRGQPVSSLLKLSLEEKDKIKRAIQLFSVSIFIDYPEGYLTLVSRCICLYTALVEFTIEGTHSKAFKKQQDRFAFNKTTDVCSLMPLQTLKKYVLLMHSSTFIFPSIVSKYF